jgi:hypothetical protein
VCTCEVSVWVHFGWRTRDPRVPPPPPPPPIPTPHFGLPCCPRIVRARATWQDEKSRRACLTVCGRSKGRLPQGAPWSYAVGGCHGEVQQDVLGGTKEG